MRIGKYYKRKILITGRIKILEFFKLPQEDPIPNSNPSPRVRVRVRVRVSC